jgi:CelD/BcsL family acetyltransferase involved in cellulose biosynthesis
LSASETILPFRVGARTLGTLRRSLVRRRVPLEAALAGEMPELPPLARDEDGFLLNALPAHLGGPIASETGLRPFVRQQYRRSYARLDQDFDAYFAGFPAKSRSTCRRKLKRMAERSGGAIDVCCYRGVEEIERFHAEARALSGRTYQERLLSAGLPDGNEALAEMRALAARDRVRGWLLRLDGRPIAYLYAPAEGGTLLYAHLGYDPDHADLSPGTVLQLEAMRQLMEERRFRLFDFTEGDGQHKRLFATDAIECVDLLLVRPTARNLLAAHALAGFDRGVALAKTGVAAVGLARIGRGLRR